MNDFARSWQRATPKAAVTTATLLALDTTPASLQRRGVRPGGSSYVESHATSDETGGRGRVIALRYALSLRALKLGTNG